jgi:hypothetical protein
MKVVFTGLVSTSVKVKVDDPQGLWPLAAVAIVSAVAKGVWKYSA